jgi:formylglycine-generating enzyme required for sulfatase activity
MALVEAFDVAQISIPKAELRAAVEGGASKVKQLLNILVDKMTPIYFDSVTTPKPPTVVVSIDQAEELFLADAHGEAQPLLSLLNSLAVEDAPAVIVVFTIRSDSYEHLQEASELNGMHKFPFDLGPMPKGSYTEVIKGPLRRLERTSRAVKIEEPLVGALLTDIEDGDTKDALPLLAFTLERLYIEYHASGQLRLDHYDRLGRVRGSIEAAVEHTLKAADAYRELPKGRPERLALLRKAFIPWLAGIDPETGNSRRRVARLREIPLEAIPLIELLVAERLLSTDVVKGTAEKTVEPAHESLLRKWSLLQGWLHEDAALLLVLHGIKRASQDWSENYASSSWLVHGGGRLKTSEGLLKRLDLAANLTSLDKDYITACKTAEQKAQSRARSIRALLSALAVTLGLSGVAWWNQDYLRDQYRWHTTVHPYFQKHFKAYVLTRDLRKNLGPLDTFRECSEITHCPMMVVLPHGDFDMGTSDLELDALSAKYPDRDKLAEDERPQRKVQIATFTIARYEVTFDEWEVCVQFGDCPQLSSHIWGRGTRPVINVSWHEAQKYIAWLSKATGASYRLPTEAEWEYAARAGSKTRYSWGDDPGQGKANCSGCKSSWDNKTAPVGSYLPNDFGLHDMHGNVREWVQDIWHDSYSGTPPTTGAAWLTGGDPKLRIIRVAGAGSWPLNLAVRQIGPSYSLGHAIVLSVSESQGIWITKLM